MRKLFSVLGNTPTHNMCDEAQARFTRFDPKDDVDVGAMTSEKKFTRFAPQHVTRAPAPTRRKPLPETVSLASAPERTLSPALQQSVNAMDHLSSEADIPLSIFRKALPQRFAKIHDNEQDSEIAAFFS